VLEPFSYLTDALFGEKIVTVLAILPVMKHIAKVLTMVKETDSRFIKEVINKQKISNDISKHFDDERIQQLLDNAAFLDPRFKKCVSNYDDTVEMIEEEALDYFSFVEEESNRETVMLTKKIFLKGFGSCIEPYR